MEFPLLLASPKIMTHTKKDSSLDCACSRPSALLASEVSLLLFSFPNKKFNGLHFYSTVDSRPPVCSSPPSSHKNWRKTSSISWSRLLHISHYQATRYYSARSRKSRSHSLQYSMTECRYSCFFGLSYSAGKPCSLEAYALCCYFSHY